MATTKKITFLLVWLYWSLGPTPNIKSQKISIYSSEYLPNHLPIFYILLSTLSKLPKTRLVFSWVAASTEQLFFIQILKQKTALFCIGNF